MNAETTTDSTAAPEPREALAPPPAAPPKAVRQPDEITELPCVLTTTELLTRSTQFAHNHRRIIGLREAKKAKGAEIQAQINALSEENRKLADAIAHGKEDRPVGCYKRENLATQQMETVRCDTDEVVYRRALGPEETQLKIWDAGARLADAAAAATGTGPRAGTGDAPPDPTAEPADMAAIAAAEGVTVVHGTCTRCHEAGRDCRDSDVEGLVCFSCEPYIPLAQQEAADAAFTEEAEADAAEVVEMHEPRRSPRKRNAK